MTRTQDHESTTFTEGTKSVAIRGGRIEVVGQDTRLQVGIERLTIGRARSCALVLEDKTVSTVHAEVQATPKGVRLVDLSSRNGTFIGNLAVTDMHLTAPCDFRCGAQRLRFVPETPQQIVLDPDHRFGDLIGTTPEMLHLFATLRRLAPSSVSIVIRGETGTGKERVAKAIHDASPRRSKPFLAINCAAMAEQLLESELFGHVRGAFTGAETDRKGLFVEAHGGTLFFDEVAEMSLAMQVKLLRALDNREVRPVGSDQPRKVDVRSLFASHTDLSRALNQGRFREDLYFRFVKTTVELPPLRNRLDDLGLLIQDILKDLGHPDAPVDDASLEMLRTRDWPGNVRELRNLVEVALVGWTDGPLVFGPAVPAGRLKEPVDGGAGSYEAAKQDFERRYYTALYAACRGSLKKMAKASGRQRPTVRAAVRAYGLVAEDDEDVTGGREGSESQ
jgi:two-component system, NtrC family, response regulator